MPATIESATVLIALGSNKPHHRHGPPPRVILAAVTALAAAGLGIGEVSRLRVTAPVGPGGRRYANAAVVATSALAPATLLALLKRVEREFGRRPGQRWGSRVLDLDLLAVGTMVCPSRLRWRTARGSPIVPHPRLAGRRFVLDPLCDIAPGWRHPVLSLTVRQLHARARRPKASRIQSP